MAPGAGLPARELSKLHRRVCGAAGACLELGQGGDGDEAVKLWTAATGQELVTLEQRGRSSGNSTLGPMRKKKGHDDSTPLIRSLRVTALPEFQFLLDFTNRTRGGIALSVLQHDQVLALEAWLKLLDLVNVDDYRAADA